MSEEAAAPPSPRLLIVDDVPEILDVLTGMARRLPRVVDVRATADPRRALQLLGSERFDAVLSDYRMPHLDGVAVLAAARRLQPHARLALMTGYNELPAQAGELCEIELDAYVSKPLELRELLRMLAALLSADEAPLAPYRAAARIQDAALMR